MHCCLQRDFRLSLFQDTILPAAFMVGLLIATFIYNELTKRYNAFRLVGERSLLHADDQSLQPTSLASSICGSVQHLPILQCTTFDTGVKPA